MRKCLNCGDKFEITNRSGKEKKYCSRRCLDSSKKKRMLDKAPLLRSKAAKRTQKWYRENRVYQCKSQNIMAELHREINYSFTTALHKLRKLNK